MLLAVGAPRGSGHETVITNDEGHVPTDFGGTIVPGLYTTGWIKRGPVGQIGNTKSDAKDTTIIPDDYRNGTLNPTGHRADELGGLQAAFRSQSCVSM